MYAHLSLFLPCCQTESAVFLFPVSYMSDQCERTGIVRAQSEKRENARAYMRPEEQGISCVRSTEGRNALSLPL